VSRRETTHLRRAPSFTRDHRLGGQLREKLHAAAERMLTDSQELERHFLQPGLTPGQAQQRAWEIVRERYLFLPPEE
jgi:hypothetical protein